SALILILGPSGIGKAKLARHLEHKLFELNFQSYLLDGRNVALGVSADIGSQQKKQEGEVVRRFGEVAKLFLDAGHVVISTSNVFNQEDHTDLRLLVDPCPVVEICVTDDKESEDRFDLKLSIAETEKEVEAANTVYKYLKDKKILTGHNYSI
ncbi:MAG TPA: adenylyl-sulfate kinase, partial [Nitrospinaceae bacterium]|nr:adenylyl-sulfate kinase [Nitrospinaceae bacterium]